jgi:hypothetical protein
MYNHIRRWPNAIVVPDGDGDAPKWTLSVMYYTSSTQKRGKLLKATLLKYARQMHGGMWDTKEAAMMDKEDFATVVETYTMSAKRKAEFFSKIEAGPGPESERTARYACCRHNNYSLSRNFQV